METVILALALAPIVSVVAAAGHSRRRGAAVVLLTIALAASVCCCFASAAGRTGASVIAALACLGACVTLIGDLAGAGRRPRSARPADATVSPVEATREVRLRARDEFGAEDWNRVKAAMPPAGTDAGDRGGWLVDLYRFPRESRPALIVLVRRDGAGGALDVRTYDVELERRCERRRRRAWPQPPPGRDRA